jgi:hypothetical protein
VEYSNCDANQVEGIMSPLLRLSILNDALRNATGAIENPLELIPKGFDY